MIVCVCLQLFDINNKATEKDEDDDDLSDSEDSQFSGLEDSGSDSEDEESDVEEKSSDDVEEADGSNDDPDKQRQQVRFAAVDLLRPDIIMVLLKICRICRQK